MYSTVEQWLSGLPPWFMLAGLALLGAIWGSFVGALCSRWPEGKTVATGRSRCDGCGTKISPLHLIPIFSYLFLRGKCPTCGSRFSIESEIIASCIGVAAAFWFPAPQAVAVAFFGWLLLPLAILDFRHLWLPDKLLLLLVAVGSIFAPLLDLGITWMDRLVGALVGFLALEALRRIYRLIRRKDGMGAGDPKLLGALGFWLGWQLLPMTLLIASFLGLLTALATQASRRQSNAAYPLGLFLAIAAFAVLFIPWMGQNM